MSQESMSAGAPAPSEADGDPGRPPLLTRQIVGFVDLLGFGEALQADNESKLNSILDLLVTFQRLSGPYIDVPLGEEPALHSRSPATSVFSDHIVLSQPIDESWGGHTISMASRIALIARSALERGFLIRGGITIGQLYHSDGIVFGPALVRAVHLESKLAVYPRVIFDPESLTTEFPSLPRLHYSIDRDGFWYSDYLTTILLEDGSLSSGATTKAEYIEFTKQWFGEKLTIADDEIKRLSKVNFGRGREKWEWHRSEILRVQEWTSSQLFKS
jgi:hypothetical protein